MELTNIYFEKNEYYYKYFELIKQKQKDGPTLQKHHILPRVYFKLMKLPVDNSDANIVKLTPANHALAHYYLALCTKGELKYRLRACFIRMTGNKRFCEKLNLEELKKLDEIKTEFGKQRSERAKGRVLTEEQRKAISERSKKMWQDPEHIALMKAKLQERWDTMPIDKRKSIGNKISKSKKGISTVPAEKRAIASEKRLKTLREAGRLQPSKETKEKIRKALMGHFVSEETKKKIELSSLGRVSYNAKSVICLETNIEYRSARYAEQVLNLPKDSVGNCCKGKRKHVNGLHWKYKK